MYWRPRHDDHDDLRCLHFRYVAHVLSGAEKSLQRLTAHIVDDAHDEAALEVTSFNEKMRELENAVGE